MLGYYHVEMEDSTTSNHSLDSLKSKLSNQPDNFKLAKKIAKKLNKPLGFHVIDSGYSKTLDKIRKGYSFLAFSIDFFFLGDKAREEMKLLKKKL